MLYPEPPFLPPPEFLSKQPLTVSQSRTYFLFAGLNFIWIGIVYLIYPETANRSLESIEAMFTTSPFYWQMEKAYAENKDLFITKAEMEGGLEKRKQFEYSSHDELPQV